MIFSRVKTHFFTATSTIGGRCLDQQHCEGLRNSVCKNDDSVKLPNGLPMKTCQCLDGHFDMRFGCEKEDDEDVFKSMFDTFSDNVPSNGVKIIHHNFIFIHYRAISRCNILHRKEHF